jgi:site-specific DNA-methyltransferase (adenine-specific)
MKEVLTEVRTKKIGNITLHNVDNMEFMRTVPDKYFDLAIVDPPYGIGENWKKDRYSKFYKHTSTYKNNQIPDRDYFDNLFRISKDQIVWGANYYTEYLPVRNSWIVWDKMKDYESVNMAEGELAWCSYNVPLRILKRVWNGFQVSEPRHGVHPHEKPTGLYKWLLKNYAKEGDKILDTHLGSGSIAIACHDYKFELTGCEIDKDYFEAAVKRLKNHVAQTTLF